MGWIENSVDKNDFQLIMVFCYGQPQLLELESRRKQKEKLKKKRQTGTITK